MPYGNMRAIWKNMGLYDFLQPIWGLCTRGYIWGLGTKLYSVWKHIMGHNNNIKPVEQDFNCFCDLLGDNIHQDQEVKQLNDV